MKHLLLSLVMTAGLQAYGSHHSGHIKAQGHVVYRDGHSLGSKEVTLYANKGHKDLTLEVDGKKVKSHSVKFDRKNGHSTLSVVFLDPPGTSKGTAALMKGTFMAGKNKAVYYGDFYTKKMSASCSGGSCSGGSCSAEKGCCEDGTCACSEGCECGDSCECDADSKCTDDCECDGCGKGGKCDGSSCGDCCGCGCDSKGWAHGGGFYFEKKFGHHESHTDPAPTK